MDFDEYQKAGTFSHVFIVLIKNFNNYKGKDVIDYITNYLKTIRDRRVFPDVEPGYIRNLLPDSAPTEGEKWNDIFNDVERVIMPGVCFIFYNIKNSSSFKFNLRLRIGKVRICMHIFQR
jgi:hypothetical protein